MVIVPSFDTFLNFKIDLLIIRGELIPKNLIRLGNPLGWFNSYANNGRVIPHSNKFPVHPTNSAALQRPD
jgi:hypothetical protein